MCEHGIAKGGSKFLQPEAKAKAKGKAKAKAKAKAKVNLGRWGDFDRENCGPLLLRRITLIKWMS